MLHFFCPLFFKPKKKSKHHFQGNTNPFFCQYVFERSRHIFKPVNLWKMSFYFLVLRLLVLFLFIFVFCILYLFACYFSTFFFVGKIFLQFFPLFWIRSNGIKWKQFEGSPLIPNFHYVSFFCNLFFDSIHLIVCFFWKRSFWWTRWFSLFVGMEPPTSNIDASATRHIC